MYIIFSNEEDRQTNEIIDRLMYYNKKVNRYNSIFSEYEKKEVLDFLKSRKLIVGEGSNETSSNIAIYHRRPSRRIIEQLLDQKFDEDDVEYPKFQPQSIYFKSLKSNYVSHQKKFFEAVLNSPEYTICKIDYHLNKYEILVKAEQAGMTIPPTLISSSKKDVIDFFKKNDGNIITKSLYNIIATNRTVPQEGFSIKCYTQKVNNINELPNYFFPTLFQKNIDKKYELRIFYLDGKCYSSAILSQQDPDSQQDFRNADRENRNRVVPYKLSAKLQSQINDLMNAIELNTGSIDIMVGLDDNSYFLEVNPVGQYGWINTYCNFGISDALAKKMIQFHGE